MNSDLTFNIENFKNTINNRVKLISIFYTSNVTGVTNPVRNIIDIAHKHGILVLLDAAQTVMHRLVDVQSLDADFLVFSSHKMLGPTGVGVLYAKSKYLDSFPQFFTGGETVEDVSYDSFTSLGAPDKFEPGIQNYAGIIGTKAAIDYLDKVGLETIEEREYKLNCLLTEKIRKIPNVAILGPKEPCLRGNILNFIVKGMNSSEIAQILDESDNIMLRSGFHCAHAWYNKEVVPPSTRVSLSFYNTENEIIKFIDALDNLIKYFK